MITVVSHVYLLVSCLCGDSFTSSIFCCLFGSSSFLELSWPTMISGDSRDVSSSMSCGVRLWKTKFQSEPYGSFQSANLMMATVINPR